jgi:hypothetical protein
MMSGNAALLPDLPLLYVNQLEWLNGYKRGQCLLKANPTQSTLL